MKILALIAERIETNFSFLLNRDYIFEPIEVDNEDDPELFSATLVLKNSSANRTIFFDINFRKEIRFITTIQKISPKENLPLPDYIAFKNGDAPHYNPPFIIDADHVLESIDGVSTIVRNLIETDLKNVIEGTEWIRILSYDPRDQANYH